MRHSRLRRSLAACALLLGLATGAVAQGQASAADTFASVMRSAMMIPHYQGAVELSHIRPCDSPGQARAVFHCHHDELWP